MTNHMKEFDSEQIPVQNMWAILAQHLPMAWETGIQYQIKSYQRLNCTWCLLTEHSAL